MKLRRLPKIKARKNKGKRTWYAEWWQTVIDPDGAKRQVHHSLTLGSGTKDAAGQKLEAHLSASSPTSATWTLGRFVDEVWLPPRMARWALHSAHSIGSSLKRCIRPTFESMPLDAIRKYHVEAWTLRLRDAGYARATAKLALTCLRSIFDEAGQNGFIGLNPAAKVRLPDMAAPARTVPYTLEQVRRLFAIPGEPGLMIRTMALCGLRPGELIALRRGDVGGDILTVDESCYGIGKFKLPKTKKVRHVALPPDLARDLASVAKSKPAADSLLFERPTGSWSVGDLLLHLQDAAAGIVDGFNCRRCRATCATLLEGDIADIRDQMGHGDIEMTLKHYRRPQLDRQKAAAADLERRISGKVLQMPKRKRA